MELGKVINYKITIDPSHNMGFVVKIGCGIFTFTTSELLINCLDEYLANPKEWEKKYNENCSGEIADEARPQQPDVPEEIAPTNPAR